MPSNTPLPASELLRLADAMADHIAYNYLDKDGQAIVEAYRAARAYSPRTLEEELLANERIAYDRTEGSSPDMIDDWLIARDALHEHARALAEAQKGGAK